MDQRLQYYIDRYTTGSITQEEVRAFAAMLKDPGHRASLHEVMQDVWTYLEDNEMDFSDVTGRMEAIMRQRIAGNSRSDEASVSGSHPAAHRVHFLRRGWLKYAAAIILIAGIAVAVTVFSDRQSARSGTELAKKNNPADILPGTNRAVLTVDNNKKITLSSAKTGITVGSDIAYTDGEKLSKAGKMLMLTTPNGGQYQLILPDGTQAWLNAASSISFPSVFEGAERRVRITGEVYLEVAKDKSKPFLVNVNDRCAVEVLGTDFNINSYGDDGKISTTLISGSVKVSSLHTTAVATVTGKADENVSPGTGRQPKTATDGVILKPGQQAVQPLGTIAVAMSSHRQPGDASGIIVKPDADLTQALAWRNGLFNFNGLSVREVMNQLARWYDIKVRYEGQVSDIIIEGKMYRNVSLSKVLEFLREIGLKFRLEENTLVVL